jgi:hypothetical protein
MRGGRGIPAASAIGSWAIASGSQLLFALTNEKKAVS